MTNIELIGIITSVLVTIIVAITTKGKNKKVDWGTTFSWLLIGLLITSHLNQREEIKKNTEVMDFYSEFKNNPSTVELARNALETEKGIATSDIAFFNSIFEKKNERFSKNLLSLQEKEISYNTNDLEELGEMYNDVIQIFNTSTNKTQIRATSYVNIEQWWTNEFGKKYSEANQEAIDKGVELTRIWIFETIDDFEKTKSELNIQKNELGVKTFYVYEKDIQELNESKIDVILVDDKISKKSFYGELELTPLRKMTSVSFGSKSERMVELNNYWSELMKLSKEF